MAIDPETKALSRYAAISSNLELFCHGIVITGLILGSVWLGRAVETFGIENSVMAVAIISAIIFVLSYAYALKSVKHDRMPAWTDGYKNVISLEEFLALNPSCREIASNLDPEKQDCILNNLKTINAREDVKRILVGLLPDSGNCSDQVQILTCAPQGDILDWSVLLEAGHREEMAIKFRFKGKVEKMTYNQFVWD